jgi:hypothetical protein
MRTPSWLLGVLLIASLATLSGGHASAAQRAGLGRSRVSAQHEGRAVVAAHGRDQGAPRRAAPGREPIVLPLGLAGADAPPGVRSVAAPPYGRSVAAGALISTLQARAPPSPSV